MNNIKFIIFTIAAFICHATISAQHTQDETLTDTIKACNDSVLSDSLLMKNSIVLEGVEVVKDKKLSDSTVTVCSLTWRTTRC